MKLFIEKNKTIIIFFLLGIAIRLIYAFFFNHMIDFMNILTITRSVAETGSVAGGFLAIKRLGNEIQLYGRIYYQVAAIWLFFLEKIGLIHIKYLFDTKPFDSPINYLIGVGQWSPPLYQLIAIKLVQFFWDIPLVFFIYKLSKEFKIDKSYLLVLFWAINPFLVMIGYGIFMSDLAMVSCLVGGIWLWIRNLKTDQEKINLSGIISISLITIGAIIKIVPILILPFVFLSFSKNFKSVLLSAFSFLATYVIVGQPFNSDSVFMKSFFLMSKESTSILNFNLNSIPVFLILYLFLFLIIFFKRNSFFKEPKNALLLTILIILILHITDKLLFIQFLIWSMPFIAIFSLIENKYIWTLILVYLSAFIIAINSSDYFSIMLAPTIGSGYSNYFTNLTLISKYLKPEIFISILRTIAVCFYLLIASLISSLLFKFKAGVVNNFTNSVKISFKKIVIFSFIAFLFFIFVDYLIKSQYILLPHRDYYYETERQIIEKKPFIVSVWNPQKRLITAIDLLTVREGTTYYENTILEIKKNNKLISKQLINDFEFPVNTDNLFTIYLKKPINEEEFDIYLYKSSNFNRIVLFKAKITESLNTPKNKLYVGYDIPINDEIISMDFHNKVFPLYLRGRYGLPQIIKGLNEHLKTKQRLLFFTIYWFFIVVLIILIIIIKIFPQAKKNE